MGDLKLEGPLDLSGSLELNTDGGKVRVGEAEVLVLLTDHVHGSRAPPVLLPPNSPVDDGPNVRIIASFNKQVKVNGNDAVVMGVHVQGDKKTWPGMVLPSEKNKGPKSVTVNNLPVNVKNDKGVTLPNGATVKYENSGQK